MDAYLVLQDGTQYKGELLGNHGTSFGELVFNTGMTGYQEVLTDPSYAGQIVLFTYPLIGNYGINEDDFQSDVTQPSGIVVKQHCDSPSNWRSRRTVHQYLCDSGVTSIKGLDTRMITKRIRSSGVTMAAITSGNPNEALEQLKQQAAYGEQDFVHRVSTKVPYAWGRNGKEEIGSTDGSYRATIVVVDCGVKFNILRRFANIGVRTIVLPCTVSADEILAWNPGGVMFSPGPGDPARLPKVVEACKGVLGKVPMFGICLGNQILCQSVGGATYKLPFGHRGSNHPVKDLRDGTVTITSQNHGYAVDINSLSNTEAVVTQINVNDETVEGIEVKDARAQSIQYHPEAAPGPWDSRKYFDQFVEQVLKG